MGIVLGEWFYGFILKLLLVFSGIFLVIALFYIYIVYKNVKKRRDLEVKIEHWEVWLRKYSKDELDREFWKKNIDDKDNEFGDFLIEKAREGNYELEILRDIYIDLNFVQEDIERLKSKKWYKKTKTLERWKRIGIFANESEMFDLLAFQNNPVRLAALNLLSHHEHPSLGKNVKNIIDFYSKKVDDYLLVKLMSAHISIENLRKLAFSDDKRLKRFGVVLLGRRGEKDAVEVLKEVRAEDENIRYEIVRSLGRIRRVEVVDLLDKMKGDESPRVRREVARSLGRVFQKGVVKDSWEELIQALTDRDGTIRILEELVEDEEHEVRVAAFLALSNLDKGGREAINRHRDEYPSLAKEALLDSFSGGVRYDNI